MSDRTHRPGNLRIKFLGANLGKDTLSVRGYQPAVYPQYACQDHVIQKNQHICPLPKLLTGCKISGHRFSRYRDPLQFHPDIMKNLLPPFYITTVYHHRENILSASFNRLQYGMIIELFLILFHLRKFPEHHAADLFLLHLRNRQCFYGKMRGLQHQPDMIFRQRSLPPKLPKLFRQFLLVCDHAV